MRITANSNASKRGGGAKAMRSRDAIRITVTLSPESQTIVERFKGANGTSTSAAIDQIIKRSEPGPSRLREVNGFLVLSDPPSDPKALVKFSVDEMKNIEDQAEQENIERLLHRDRPTSRKRASKR
jgi:hypothetical protein